MSWADKKIEIINDKVLKCCCTQNLERGIMNNFYFVLIRIVVLFILIRIIILFYIN